MARVNSRASANPGSGRAKPSSRRTRSHKVVFESFIEEQKKLRTVISFKAKAPAGFKFIPAGSNPRLTQKCKELSQEYDKKVHIVSTSHKKANTITQHVHRIGYHFDNSVVSEACRALGLRAPRARRLSAAPYIRPGIFGVQAEHDIAKADVSSQGKLNAQARAALTEFFPNMPEYDKNRIISHAFREGKKKVGTAKTLPFVRRVQLAVLAHIRHVHTSYDRLLRNGSRQTEARANVEQACYRKIVEWSGDGENANIMKEILREVIVISDDEGEDEVNHDEMSVDESTDEEDSVDQDSDVEFICSRPIVQEPTPESSWPKQAGEREDGTNNDDGYGPYLQDKFAKDEREHAVESAQPLRRSNRLRVMNRRGFHRYSAFKDLQDDELPANNEAAVSLRRAFPTPGRSSVPDLRRSSAVDTQYGAGDNLVGRASTHRYRDESVVSPTVPFPQHWERRTRNGPSAGQNIDSRSPHTANQHHSFSRPIQRAPISTIDAGLDNAVVYPQSVLRRDDWVPIEQRLSDAGPVPPFEQRLLPPSREETQGQQRRAFYMAAPTIMTTECPKEQDMSSSGLEPRPTVLPSVEHSQDVISRHTCSTRPVQAQSNRFHPSQDAQYERYNYPRRIERIVTTDRTFIPPDTRNQTLEGGSGRPNYTIMTDGEILNVASINAVHREPPYSLRQDNPPVERKRLLASREADDMLAHSPLYSVAVLNNKTSPETIWAPMAGTGLFNEDDYRGRQLPVRAKAARPLHGVPLRTSPPNCFTARRNDFPSSFRSFVPEHASLAHSQGSLSDFNRPVRPSGSPVGPSLYAWRSAAGSGLDPHTVPVNGDLSAHQRSHINPSASAEHLQGYRQAMHVNYDRTSETHLSSEFPAPRMTPHFSLRPGQASPDHEPHERSFSQAQDLVDAGLATSVNDANVRYLHLHQERRFPREIVNRSTGSNMDHACSRSERHLREPQYQQSLVAGLGSARILDRVDSYGRDRRKHQGPESHSRPSVIVLD